MPILRIISAVPSQTELLFNLGLDKEVIGVTKFCLYPSDKIAQKAIIGGTKTLDINKIKKLNPTLILANKEENTREQIEELQQLYAVHVTNVATLSDALTMICDVGSLVGKFKEAQILAQRIENTLQPTCISHTLSVAYFIWQNPYMVAANDTFIHAMLEIAGFQNAFANHTRYPIITPVELQNAQPDLIFLSSEPYPFREKHLSVFREICPFSEIVLVDGEMFSWYGSRLLLASNYFRNLRNKFGLHPS